MNINDKVNMITAFNNITPRVFLSAAVNLNSITKRSWYNATTRRIKLATNETIETQRATNEMMNRYR